MSTTTPRPQVEDLDNNAITNKLYMIILRNTMIHFLISRFNSLCKINKNIKTHYTETESSFSSEFTGKYTQFSILNKNIRSIPRNLSSYFMKHLSITFLFQNEYSV